MNNFKNLWISKLCFWVFLLLIGPLSSTAMAANVLVVKNSSLPLPGDALIADLRNLGHIVTDATSLPAGALELSFDTIWYVNVNQPPGPAQRTQLADFLAAGKGLHLTGGDTVQDPNNAIIESFINTDLNLLTVTVGGLGNIVGPYAFNPTATGSITTSPNVLGNLCISGGKLVGGMAGLATSNVLIEGTAPAVVGAVWDSAALPGGVGRLTLLMNPNWYNDADTVCRNEIIENMQTFLDFGAPIVNAPPVADAGAPTLVAAGSTQNLDGSGSNDPESQPLTYFWSDPDGVITDPDLRLNDPTLENPEVIVPDVAGGTEFTFRLVVNDGFQDSAPSLVTHTVVNNPPVAFAGDHATILEGNAHTVTNVSATDAETPDSGLTLTWEFAGAFPPLTVDDPSTPQDETQPEPELVVTTDPRAPIFPASYRVTENQLFGFFLVANDGVQDSDPSLLIISVVNNKAPVAKAGTDQVHLEQPASPGTKVFLNGAASVDPDNNLGVLNYSWTKISGPPLANLVDTNTATPSFDIPLVPADTTIIFSLIVSDGLDFSVADTVGIEIINNQVPLASASASPTPANGGELVTLDGSGSSDPDNHPLTAANFWTWSQTAGPLVTLSNINTAQPTFLAPSVSTDTTLTFSLLTDDGLDQSTAVTNVKVLNGAPAVSIAGPANIPGGASDTLVSTVVDQGFGGGTYVWTQLSGPAAASTSPALGVSGPNPTLVVTAPDIPTPDVAAKFQVVYTDEGGLTTSAIVTTTFNATIPTCDPAGVKLFISMKTDTQNEIVFTADDPNGNNADLTVTRVLTATDLNGDPFPGGIIPGNVAFIPLVGEGVLRVLTDTPMILTAVVKFTDVEGLFCETTATVEVLRLFPIHTISESSCIPLDDDIFGKGLVHLFLPSLPDGTPDVKNWDFAAGKDCNLKFGRNLILPANFPIHGIKENSGELCGPPDGSAPRGCVEKKRGINSPYSNTYEPTDGVSVTYCLDPDNFRNIDNNQIICPFNGTCDTPVNGFCDPFDRDAGNNIQFNANADPLIRGAFDLGAAVAAGCSYFCDKITAAGTCDLSASLASALSSGNLQAVPGFICTPD